MPLTPDEQAELNELQTGGGKSALSPDEHAEMAQLQKELPTPAMTPLEAVKTGARAGAKVLDYQRGAGAVGVDHLAQMAGLPPGMSPEQSSAALSPFNTQTAPSYRTLLKNWGVPEGVGVHSIPAHMGIMGVLAQHAPDSIRGLSMRDAVGTGADIGLDPLTYESGGLQAAAAPIRGTLGRIARVFAHAPTTVSDAGRAASTALYEGGIRPIIQAGERYGNPNVGATMMREGISGTPSAIEQGMETSASRLKTSRDAIHTEADAAGARASKSAALTPMFQQLQQLIQDQRLTGVQASRILNDLTLAKQAGGDTVPSALMSQWKTDVGHALPGSTWDELSKANPTLANDVKQTTQAGYRQEAENSVGRALGPEQQANLVSQNSELGNLINPDVRKAANAMAIKHENVPLLSTSDLLFGLAGAGGAGLIHQGHTMEAGMGIVGLKKLIETARSTRFKTNAGLLGDRVLNSGIAPLIDSGARRAATDFTRKSPYNVSPDTVAPPANRSSFYIPPEERK